MRKLLNLSEITPMILSYNQKSYPKTEIVNPDLVKSDKLISDLSDESTGEVIIKPLPYDYIKQFDKDTLNLVMQFIGLYTFPTIELIDWLRSQIDDDPNYEPHSAIEICSGTGWIGRSLNIPTTDLRIQEDPIIQLNYELNNAMTINYPSDIEKLEASEAVKKYKPDIVIGSYVTHKYGMPNSSMNYGSVFGVNTINIINNCWKYIMIGNDSVHCHAPEMKRPHQRLSFPWLVTRGDVSKARIYIWENKNWFK